LESGCSSSTLQPSALVKASMRNHQRQHAS
jgi:hypothetical protein